jgi:tRNA 2-thiouridine synthesizing protein A
LKLSADRPSSGEDDPVLFLDARGLNCPLPVLKARKAIGALPVGARMVIEATDQLASLDIPHFCSEDGHRLVARETDGRILRFTIERGR